jgi:hypothetical protein
MLRGSVSPLGVNHASPHSLRVEEPSSTWGPEAAYLLKGAKNPTPESRPRQRETLIEIYRKGKIDEAFNAFKKIYLEIVDEVIDHLENSSD